MPPGAQYRRARGKAFLSYPPLSTRMNDETRRLLDHSRISFERLAQRRTMFVGGAIIAAAYVDWLIALTGFTLCYLLDYAEMKACAATRKARDLLDEDARLRRRLTRRLHVTGSASTFAVVLFIVGSTLVATEALKIIPTLFLISAALYWAVSLHQIKAIARTRAIIIATGVTVILAEPLIAMTPAVASPFWPKALTTAVVFYFIDGCAAAYAKSYDRSLDQIASVRAALEETARSARHKSDLLRVLSHELRTPLNGVMGMAELIRLGPLTDAQRLQVETLRTSAVRLDELIGEVMDSERLEAGRLRIVKAPFRLSSVIDPVIDRHRPGAEAKRLALRVEAPPTLPRMLVIDGDRVRRCLDHLISNAVKFTDAGEVVVRCAHAAQPGPPVLTIEVTDTGIGMTEDTLKSIFERFSQDNMSEARAYGGLGVGLWISRVSAELMGGDLTVKSAPGEGSTFTLTLIAEEAKGAAVSALLDAKAG